MYVNSWCRMDHQLCFLSFWVTAFFVCDLPHRFVSFAFNGCSETDVGVDDFFYLAECHVRKVSRCECAGFQARK